ncbi:MAG TPA: response regulator [Candidatus Binatia bacterium]|nr:response regulator [Candidatus Binatia bacterium]
MPAQKPRLRLRILAMDHDRVEGNAIRSALQSAEADCILETSGSQGLEFLKREKYDLVILDAHMSAPDGLQLARLIRRGGLNSRTPIILLGERSMPEATTRAFESGANFFLYKPFDRTGLMRALRAARGPIEQERRRFLRIQVRCHVVLLRGKERVEGETLDLSLEGMLVETPAAWATGSKLRLALELVPGEEPWEASGKVVRLAGPNRMGIQLDPPKSEESARLQTFLLPLILKSLGEEPT